MTKSAAEIEQMVRNAQGIPANPEVQARMASDTVPATAQPAVPPGQEPATTEDAGLDPSAVDFFGNLAADMDAETHSSPEPTVQPAQHLHGVQAPVEELPYEPPVTQRVPGEAPESLVPSSDEVVPLEAAIEQPLVEEEIRMTADQWAAQQRAMNPPTPQEQPVQQPQFNPAELEAQAIENLTNTEYVLSEDEKTQLIAEPDQVIPRLAARMHVRMQVQLANQIAQILPSIVNNMIQQQGKVSKLENQFFSQYRELDKPEFRDTVQQSLQMIRQVNPNATREEVMRDGAALAAVRLKTRLGETTQQQPRPSAAPGNMPMGAPSTQPTPQVPFTPAQAGGGTEPVVPTDPNAGNIFATLANDDDW